eukprot:7383801-Prymnesium_polylepis.1
MAELACYENTSWICWVIEMAARAQLRLCGIAPTLVTAPSYLFCKTIHFCSLLTNAASTPSARGARRCGRAGSAASEERQALHLVTGGPSALFHNIVRRGGVRAAPFCLFGRASACSDLRAHGPSPAHTHPGGLIPERVVSDEQHKPFPRGRAARGVAIPVHKRPARRSKSAIPRRRGVSSSSRGRTGSAVTLELTQSVITGTL